MNVDTIATVVGSVIGTAVVTWGTVRVAHINRAEAKPAPDTAHPKDVDREQEARVNAWRDLGESVVSRLIDAEVEIRQLKTSDAAKDERIAADAGKISKLTDHVADLVAYVRVLLSEIRRSGGRPPEPPAGLDLEL